MAVLERALRFWTKRTPGLDIDALRTVSRGVNALAKPDRAIIVVTHYQRLLEYIRAGTSCTCSRPARIVRSGGKELALELEEPRATAGWKPLWRERRHSPWRGS
jgi:Fe-S cluster assembly ATP-binding protein